MPGQWICASCEYVYDPAEGFYDAERGREFPPGTPFEELPGDVICPHCGAAKTNFRPLDADPPPA